jgi:hypothetical protein
MKRSAGKLGGTGARRDGDYIGGMRPRRKKTSASIKPTTKSIHAMLEAVPATPVKPNKPAMIATTRKTKAQFNMTFSFAMFA